jgi:hypothetical protein
MNGSAQTVQPYKAEGLPSVVRFPEWFAGMLTICDCLTIGPQRG